MAETTFAELALRPALLEALTALGYEAPTPIQERTIPALLSGRDVIGQAQTGTGKTAAFALPILEKLDPEKRETQALVLTPTRELAMQVAEAIHSYARGIPGISVLPVYGGASIVLQMKHLQRGAQIVVGTPGRIIDHLDRKTLRLDNVKMVVLDEADEMLRMGFIDDVERIIKDVPLPRQVALFSATMPDEIARIARKHLVDPIRVEVEHRALTAPDIEQRFLNISEGQKLEVLTQLLELEPSEAVLIFRRTKTGAAELAEKLEARGFAAVAMHGDMNQPLRESVIRRLRAGQIEIVVATDVAARGLDVEQISHVINYDIPNDVEAYVHRVGRTGRAGRSGLATLFITPRERRMMREIERFTGSAIKPMKLPTPADVTARRITVFKESLRKSLEEGDLELYVELVQQLAEEGPFDMADIAAAAARLASGTKAVSSEKPAAPVREKAYVAATPVSRRPPPRERTAERSLERTVERPAERTVERPVGRSAEHRPSSSMAPARRAPDSRGERPERNTEPKVRLSMAVGTKDGIRPADIVGSIANEADVPGRDIGPIDIREELTIVVIPQRYQDQVLKKVAGKRFRGRPLNVQIADEASDAVRTSRTFAAERGGPRRESSPRESPREGPRSSAPPRKPAPRPGADRTFRGSSSAPHRATAGKSFPPRTSARDETRSPAPRRAAAPRGTETGKPARRFSGEKPADYRPQPGKPFKPRASKEDRPTRPFIKPSAGKRPYQGKPPGKKNR